MPVIESGGWKPPAGMSPYLAAMVADGRACGKLLHGGGYCTRRPVPGQGVGGQKPPYRCSAHGGVERAPVDPCMIAALPWEGALLEALGPTDLSPEVRVARLRLWRAMAIEAELLEAEVEGVGDPEALDRAAERIHKLGLELQRMVRSRAIDQEGLPAGDDGIDVADEVAAMIASFTAGRPRD